ncbi:sulfotransferase family 2 domain-containing protein [Nitrosococcus watsonii]|nr:sulfotransferase family 2 domain-containing protein [Nitrosococcus watsonii]
MRHQFIFVHIPKTAGNAMQNALSSYSEDTIVASGNKDGVHRFGLYSLYGTTKHSTLTDYFFALGAEAFWSKRKFTCIRNPWDRAISFYFSPHHKNYSWNRDKFIRMLDKIHPMTTFLRLPDHVANTEPDQNVDLIIRYEDLHKGFSKLCDILGISRRSLLVLNKGNRKSYFEYYDSELIQIVAERFREDIEVFGYEFDSSKRY